MRNRLLTILRREAYARKDVILFLRKTQPITISTADR